MNERRLPGRDRLLQNAAAPSFLFSNIDASGYQRRSVELDPASVQRWISFPLENEGLVLANGDAGKVLRIYSSEAVDVSKRPTLEVSFE